MQKNERTLQDIALFKIYLLDSTCLNTACNISKGKRLHLNFVTGAGFWDFFYKMTNVFLFCRH